MKKVRHEHVKPTEDLVAKKIFSNTEITSAFVSDILGLSVKCTKILDGTQIHSSFEDDCPLKVWILKKVYKKTHRRSGLLISKFAL